jgi:hypothetical protein
MEDFMKIIGLIAMVIALWFLVVWIVMLLWNWLMPMIFGLTTLNYWESFGLFALCGALFKNVSTK